MFISFSAHPQFYKYNRIYFIDKVWDSQQSVLLAESVHNIPITRVWLHDPG